MRILVACESSGTVRDAFTARGHSAASADLLPSETDGEHYEVAEEGPGNDSPAFRRCCSD